MSLLIKNWSIANWEELLKWAKIGANNAMIGEFAEVEEIPPHGRLIDADALKFRLKTETGYAGSQQITTDFLCVLKGDIVNTPTIIPAEEDE